MYNSIYRCINIKFTDNHHTTKIIKDSQMKKIILILSAIAFLTLTGCSLFKTNEVPVRQAFTGKYRMESSDAVDGKEDKLKGEIKILETNGGCYVTGHELSTTNPAEVYKFSGKGDYDEDTQTLTMLFTVNNNETIQGVYEKTDYGFKWISSKDDKGQIVGYDKWIKIDNNNL